MTNYRFVRTLADGSTFHLGTAVQHDQGWRFIPNVASHKSSRKFHATMEKCLPRWVGYPDHCASVAVEPRKPVAHQEGVGSVGQEPRDGTSIMGLTIETGLCHE